MTKPITVHARCLCGDVRITATLPSLWMAHCHCHLCQQQSGAAFVTWVGFQESDCHIETKNNSLHWYSATPQAQRGFCQACGSSMLFKSSRWPGELHITVVNFEDELDRLPQTHVFHDSRQPWLPMAADLPRENISDSDSD